MEQKVNGQPKSVKEAIITEIRARNRRSLRRKHGINVVGIRKQDKLMINVDPEMPLRKDMTLVVIASKQSLKKLV